LIADDEFLVRQMLEETALRRDLDVVTAGSGEEAIEILKGEDEFQMAFVDLKMGIATGMDVLKFCCENKPKTLFVIMTAYGTLETAIEAMKLGAFDFVIKPFSPDQMDIMIEKGRHWLELNERDQYFQKEISTSGISGAYKPKAVGASEEMQKVNKLIERVAPTDATVLITGESGTGKELIASEIFRLSDTSGSKPYIRMNCAAVPENLLESELFGHEKGAFTGASERRIGRFELANGGTLLLDEIGEITPAMQSKLLRVLQESEFERVGGSKTIKVNVRVIATTNRNLKEEVNKGNFREDLFYRLNVFPISLPPLRRRGEDCLEIAKHFLNIQEKKLGRKLKFSDSALEAIQEYSWPGNIRELENVIERIAILEDGPIIEAEAFPSDIFKPIKPVSSSDDDNLFDMREIEKNAIKKALKKTKGNKTRAADLLGFSVRTLRNKLNEYKSEGLLDKELSDLISSDN
jgi:two-component system response regulator AtoC